ncbi:MAG: (2Fe-2S)-binding protein [Caldisericota bacterium]|nr:(2Fe-2S)-binding protein [Caldisericota bacterium]
MNVKVTVNSQAYERDVAENRTLLRFLREDLGLTGTKEGCGAGECGACTVYMNGKTVNACMVLAVEADGAVIETIEGEAADGVLSKLQEAFDRDHAVQCGFCTPGMIMSAKEVIHNHPKPTVEQIKEGLEGNLCRCTGYQQIIEAVLDATGQLTTREGLRHAGT